MIFPFEVAMVDRVITSHEKDPVVGRFKVGRIIIHHRRIFQNAMMRTKFHDRIIFALTWVN